MKRTLICIGAGILLSIMVCAPYLVYKKVQNDREQRILNEVNQKITEKVIHENTPDSGVKVSEVKEEEPEQKQEPESISQDNHEFPDYLVEGVDYEIDENGEVVELSVTMSDYLRHQEADSYFRNLPKEEIDKEIADATFYITDAADWTIPEGYWDKVPEDVRMAYALLSMYEEQIGMIKVLYDYFGDDIDKCYSYEEYDENNRYIMYDGNGIEYRLWGLGYCGFLKEIK